MSVSERGVARQSPSRPEICSAQGCQLARPSSPAISSAHTVGDGHQRCADPEMLCPHQSADPDHRSASATASAGRCRLGSAVSPRVRDSLSYFDLCLIGPASCPRFGMCWGVFIGAIAKQCYRLQ